MNSGSISATDALAFARRIANHAAKLGIETIQHVERQAVAHLGALLADSVLQAGLNYRTVVKPRVDRIIREFPEAHDVHGVFAVIEAGSVAHFLLWDHQEKRDRFVKLAVSLHSWDIEDVGELRIWLQQTEARQQLLQLRGVGPKTVDYMCCLVGLDHIAVDRHIRMFAAAAGVPVTDYEAVKLVTSYAADFLGISRRSFDAWVWNEMSARWDKNRQYLLL